MAGPLAFSFSMGGRRCTTPIHARMFETTRVRIAGRGTA
jgi:hypothetical protein